MTEDRKGITFIKEQKCPYCGVRLTALSDIPHQSEGCKPGPGDAVVCIRCGNVQMIKEDGSLGKMPKSRLKRLDEESRHTIQKVKSFIERKKNAN